MIRKQIPTLWPVIDGPAKGQHLSALGEVDALYVCEASDPPVRLVDGFPQNVPLRQVRYELRELDTGGYVWTCDEPPPAPSRAIVVNPTMGSKQGMFESGLMARFGIKLGALAISSDGSRYINEHVQWLWENHK